MVLAGNENATRDERGTPRIFDWVALREVERYTESTTEILRLFARIVMSDKGPESKIDETNLQLLTNLQQRKVLGVYRIRREEFTGGEYRKELIESADAMLAIGGGKGTYSTGAEMIRLGKPVLPLDLQLGSISNDGEGAVTLHREMVSDPSRFFPNTHSDVKNRIEMISLNRGTSDVRGTAQVAAEIVERELAAIPEADWSVKVKQRLVTVWQFHKLLPVNSSAINRIVELIRGLFIASQ